MIVKNEEDYIVDCIRSVRHLIDEIVVMDTGSTDSTIEQGLAEGAKIYHYNWQQNFAEARNYALEQATGDWILVLDADERLEYIDRNKFNDLLIHSEVEGYFITIESDIGNGEEKIVDQVVRLFKNKASYRFSGAIHEQVVGSIKENNGGEGLASTEFKIIHRGYLNKRIKEKSKHVRNMEVIHQALLHQPCDSFLRYSLGIEYIQQGEITQANEQLTIALKNLTGREGYSHSVVVNLASGLLQTGQLQQAEDLIDQALIVLPNDSDLILLKGMVALHKKDYAATIPFLQQSIAGKTENTLVSSIHTLCGDLYVILDCCDQAELEYVTSLQNIPQHMYPLCQIIGLKQRGKSQLTWHRLSQFTSYQINKKLQLQLTNIKEVPLALVLALLNIMNQNTPGNVDITNACNDYLQAVMLYRPTDELSTLVIEYLICSAKMMLLYARMIVTNCDCTFVSITQKIADINNNNLDIIIRTLCPTWIPCITLHTMLPNVEL